MITTIAVPPAATLPTGLDRWKAIDRRDPAADGQFVFAVTTTRIYCRPTCPSRRPRREHVRFFEKPAEAERAGFRACRRCHPEDAVSPAVARVEKARTWIDTHADEPPVLARLGRVAGVSPWHLQRSFRRLYGVSPREYAAARRVGRLKAALRAGSSSVDAVYEAGYGSPSRVYDAAPGALGMTPRAYRAGGASEEIRYAIADSAVGRVLVASTARGLCRVALGANDADLARDLAREFPHAAICRDDEGMKRAAGMLVQQVTGNRSAMELPTDVKATLFQRRVWKALQQIPYGKTRTYGEVAAAIGQPGAARAVARACATNPLALAIPCHRVVPASGGTGGYRWGKERKARLLARERVGK